MSHASQNTKTELAGEIERQSLRAENRRFLRAMPQFAVDLALPDRLRELLAQLDGVSRPQELPGKAGGR